MVFSNTLNYKIVGEGYPVVFLHGFLESIYMWEYIQIEIFHFQSILIDLHGHGESLNEDEKEPSIEFMAEKVLEVLSDLKIRSFSIVGHSMGGYVALSIKNKSVNNLIKMFDCHKVVLLNSNFWVDSDLKKNDRLRVAEIVFQNKDLFLHTAIPNLFNEPNKYKNQISILLNEALLMSEHDIAYSSLAMRNRADFTNLIANFESDFLIIQGENDSMVTKDLMEKMISEFTIKYVLIKEVGHMAHIQSPLVVKDSICKYILNSNS